MNTHLVQEKLEAIWPEVIGAVVTKRGDAVNLCPVNYQAISTVYEQPLSVCFGLNNQSQTLQTLLQTGEFVYAYPSTAQLRDILYCGTVSGRDGDKLAQTQLQFESSAHVAPPRLMGAVLNVECRVLHHYNVGEFTIVIGQIMAMVDSPLKNLDKIYAFGNQQYGAIDSVTILQQGRA